MCDYCAFFAAWYLGPCQRRRSQRYETVAQEAAVREDATYKGHIRNLPVVEGETVQLGRGSSVFLSDRAAGRNAVLITLGFTPKLSKTAILDPDWVAIGVPLRWRGDFLCNGQVARPYDAFLVGGPNGYTNLGEDQNTIALGLRRSELRAACAALQGIPPEEIELEDLRLRFDDMAGRKFQRMLMMLLASSVGASPDPFDATIGAAQENDLVSDIALLLTHRKFNGQCSAPSKMNALQIVRTAMAAADTHGPGSTSLADLCAITGVGQTWLHKAFVDICGTSPMKMMRARRMTQVRNMLLDSTQPAPCVKYAARTFGFVESGRFAREYRQRFGENPSQTLLARTIGRMASVQKDAHADRKSMAGDRYSSLSVRPVSSSL